MRCEKQNNLLDVKCEQKHIAVQNTINNIRLERTKTVTRVVNLGC